jgi:hypothetical protein
MTDPQDEALAADGHADHIVDRDDRLSEATIELLLPSLGDPPRSWETPEYTTQRLMNERDISLRAARQRGEALAAVRDLHERDEIPAIIDRDCLAEECSHEGECPTKPFAVCGHCLGIAEDLAEIEERIPESVVWPCPTIKALDAVQGAGA